MSAFVVVGQPWCSPRSFSCYSAPISSRCTLRRFSSDVVKFAESGTPFSLNGLSLEGGKLPMNTWKNEKPYAGEIVSVEKIVGPNSPGEIYHVVIDHGGKMPYWEGQSFGVVPPGMNEKTNKPHGVRLYSIASTRYGDDLQGKTASFCIRRAKYYDPETKQEDPAKAGVCSNYICDLKPGAEVSLTGPTGKALLLRDEDTAPQVMVATGTGIAPFRSFLRRMFMEDVPQKDPARRKSGPPVYLFFGVPNSDAFLYDDELRAIEAHYGDRFKLVYAVSREGPKNKRGGKMYVQDRVEEHAKDLWRLMEDGAHFYFCGLKGMMPGISKMLEAVSVDRGENWTERLKQLKKNKQWHVEVY